MYTHIHTYLYIHMFTYTALYIHVYTHTYIFVHTYVYIHSVIHTYIHTYMHICTYIYIHTQRYTYIHIHIYTCVYMTCIIHTYLYIYSVLHTYIHIYIYTCIRLIREQLLVSLAEYRPFDRALLQKRPRNIYIYIYMYTCDSRSIYICKCVQHHQQSAVDAVIYQYVYIQRKICIHIRTCMYMYDSWHLYIHAQHQQKSAEDVLIYTYIYIYTCIYMICDANTCMYIGTTSPKMHCKSSSNAGYTYEYIQTHMYVHNSWSIYICIYVQQPPKKKSAVVDVMRV